MRIGIHVASGTGGMSRRHMPRGYLYSLVVIAHQPLEHLRLRHGSGQFCQDFSRSRQKQGAEKHRPSRPDQGSSRGYFDAPCVDVWCPQAPLTFSADESGHSARNAYFDDDTRLDLQRRLVWCDQDHDFHAAGELG